MRRLGRPRQERPGVGGSTEEVQIRGSDDLILKNASKGLPSVKDREG